MLFSSSWLGCIQISQPARSAIIGAWPQWSEWACVHTTRLRVLQAQVAHRQRPFQVGQRVGLVHARVEQHEAVARRHRPGVAVGNARPRQRQPQAEDAGQHSLAPAQLALALAPARRRRGCAIARLGHAAETRLRISSGVLEEAGMAEGGEGASKAATKVQEAAANVRQARSPRKRITKSTAESVARRYFEAIGARDLDTAVGLWAEGGRDNVRGQVDVLAPEGVRAFLGELLDAVPDLRFEVVSTTTQDERCAVQWRPQRHVRRTGVAQRHPADRRPLRDRGDRPADRQGRPDPVQRRVPRLDRPAAPDRHDPAAGLDRRPAADGRVQRQDAPRRAAVRERRRAGRRGRVGRAGPAGALQRLPDRGRGRRDAVRRRRAHDDARAGAAPAPSSAASAGSCSATGTPTTAAPRPGSACRSSATPTRCRTPKAAAAFATGRRASPGCPSPTASCIACCIATPGTAAR